MFVDCQRFKVLVELPFAQRKLPKKNIIFKLIATGHCQLTWISKSTFRYRWLTGPFSWLAQLASSKCRFDSKWFRFLRVAHAKISSSRSAVASFDCSSNMICKSRILARMWDSQPWRTNDSRGKFSQQIPKRQLTRNFDGKFLPVKIQSRCFATMFRLGCLETSRRLFCNLWKKFKVSATTLTGCVSVNTFIQLSSNRSVIN